MVKLFVGRQSVTIAIGNSGPPDLPFRKGDPLAQPLEVFASRTEMKEGHDAILIDRTDIAASAELQFSGPTIERSDPESSHGPDPGPTTKATDRSAPIELTVLDLRSVPSFLRGHLPGAVSVPVTSLSEGSHLLPHASRPLLLCGSQLETLVEAADQLAGKRTGLVFYWHLSKKRSGTQCRVVEALCHETGPARRQAWEPAPFLAEWEPELPRSGVFLDLACGTGRNTVFLARRPERRVFGVDILPEALEKARRLRALERRTRTKSRTPARNRNCPPESRSGFVGFHQADLRQAAVIRRWLPPSRNSAVTCFRYLDRDLLPRIAKSLRPGGWLIYQTFLEAQRDKRGRPKNPRFLLKPGELKDAFSELECVAYEEGVDAEGDVLASFCGRARD